MKKSSQAFTLVELLVVITIIGILAGIALPVFLKAQEKGKAISDLSNLRQLGIAVQAYKADNDNNILEAGGTSKWPQQLNPTYVSTWKVFKSPFDKRTASETAATAPVSYGINNEGTTTLLGSDSSKVNYPSNLILFAPTVNTAATGGDVSFVATNYGTTDVFVTAPTIAARGTHGSRLRVNVVYNDGHAEDILWLKFMDKKTDPEGKKRWLPDYVPTANP